MGNIWLKKKKREEAREALQKWCNKEAYDSFGYHTNKTLMEMRISFFKKHPEYKEFDKDFKIVWYGSLKGDTLDATGIPTVIIKEDS